MDGDMNDIFQKLNSMMSDKETADNLKNIINNFNASSSNSSQAPNEETFSDSSSSATDNEATSNSPNFDINTILKIKSIMDNLNSSQNDSRANLLLSLKPYLNDSKKEKIDQYIKFLKIANVFETMNLSGGDLANE